jgi:hypothetical protein
VGWTRGMGGVKFGAISPGMPSTEEFVGRILRDLYCTLFIAFSKNYCVYLRRARDDVDAI